MTATTGTASLPFWVANRVGVEPRLSEPVTIRQAHNKPLDVSAASLFAIRVVSSSSPFSAQHEPWPDQADQRGQEEEASEHVHGEDDEEPIAHLGLETQGRKGPKGDSGGDQKGGVKDRLPGGGHAFDQGRPEILLFLLSLMLLDRSGHDVNAVVNAEPDPEADDRHRVDIEADIPEPHQGSAEHVRDEDYADEEEARKD